MSSYKRIFVGSFIRTDIGKKLTYLKKDLGGLVSGRWVKEENLHITFKFIGEVPAERVKIVKESLEDLIEKEIEVNITLKGLGVFPNIREPRVLYIKVSHSQTLDSLRKEIEDRLYKIGFKKEIKPFIPHITINRIKEVKPAQLLEKLGKFESYVFGNQNTISINVIESILNHTGAEYIVV